MVCFQVAERDPHLVIECCLVLDNLDGDLLAGVLPHTSDYLSKGALPEQVPHGVSVMRHALLESRSIEHVLGAVMLDAHDLNLPNSNCHRA